MKVTSEARLETACRSTPTSLPSYRQGETLSSLRSQRRPSLSVQCARPHGCFSIPSELVPRMVACRPFLRERWAENRSAAGGYCEIRRPPAARWERSRGAAARGYFAALGSEKR